MQYGGDDDEEEEEAAAAGVSQPEAQIPQQKFEKSDSKGLADEAASAQFEKSMAASGLNYPEGSSGAMPESQI